MTIEQRKISIINWITNLQDEHLLSKIEDFRRDSLDNLPKEIIKLLELADAEDERNLIEHTSSREILKKS